MSINSPTAFGRASIWVDNSDVSKDSALRVKAKGQGQGQSQAKVQGLVVIVTITKLKFAYCTANAKLTTSIVGNEHNQFSKDMTFNYD